MKGPALLSKQIPKLNSKETFMSSLSKVGRFAAARKNDRVSLCSFTFSDGRRCRTPRAAKHPHFCFYHAQKEARARAAEKLGKDLAYFFSGDYLSACDLSTALSRLIPAVVRGDIKPKTARTVAYLAQTLLQAIHISQDEYINAFRRVGQAFELGRASGWPQTGLVARPVHRDIKTGRSASRKSFRVTPPNIHSLT